MPRLKDIIQDNTSNWLEAELDAYDRDRRQRTRRRRRPCLLGLRPPAVARTRAQRCRLVLG